MSSIQVEILKPAIITMPENIDTIAVFKRDLYQSDTTTFEYFGLDHKVPIIDTLVKYSNLSNRCVNAFANQLETEGFFMKVINYEDSMNYLFTKGDNKINYPELLKKLKVDACIFLDYFNLVDISSTQYGYNFTNSITENFPEFRGSTKFEKIMADLFWTISVKGDTSKYVCRQPDELYYGNSVYTELFGNDMKHRKLLDNASEYLGKDFGTKVVPSWLKVERTYYRSNNINMLKAEKYCMKNDWLKAAEIYNSETNNKNRNIAAKAKYNMAMICEMEGNLDAAIDWLVRSYSTYKCDNEDHKFNCKQYIDLLAMRKQEIAHLEKQIRNHGNNEEN